MHAETLKCWLTRPRLLHHMISHKHVVQSYFTPNHNRLLHAQNTAQYTLAVVLSVYEQGVLQKRPSHHKTIKRHMQNRCRTGPACSPGSRDINVMLNQSKITLEQADKLPT